MSQPQAYLILRADFLARTYGGEEWPPAPFRLMQAIVAGCRSIEAPGLSWLERQAPPFILAVDEPEPVRFARAIPNNADPRKPKSSLSMRSVTRRRIEDPVLYVWPLRDAEDHEQAKLLAASANTVHTLGTGEDMCSVRGLITSSPPESGALVRLWLPTAGQSAHVYGDSDVVLRVPVPGSLQSLEDRFQAFQKRLSLGDRGYARPVSAPALHHVVRYRSSDHMPRAAIVAFRLLQPDGSTEFRSFRAENAVVLAGMLRHAAMRLAKAHAPELDGFASGHPASEAPNARMSWVPLPSVGHRHADGSVRRALWMCRASEVGLLSEIADALPGAGLPLIDEDTGECLAIASPVDAQREPVLARYLGSTQEWVSVTPVILPGEYGGGDVRLMTRLLHKAVREAGIDPGLIEHAEFSKSALLRQAAQIRDVRLKDWSAKNLILYHVRLRFRAPIRGPLVLGRGKHYGLGLFCANPK